jgi:ABC-type transport system involved in multi-copper enzyme maturation permease subunit
MTATSLSAPAPVLIERASGPLAGLRPLFRKDIADWRSGKGPWIVFIVTTLFMALQAANSYITSYLVRTLPADQTGGATSQPISLVPLDNILTSVGSQIFVFVAIFAAMGLLVAERERGTLSWVASKPVSRSSILASKFASGTAVIWLTGAILPMIVTTATVVALYGVPSLSAVALITLGMGAAIALYVAVALTASTFVASQPGVAGITFAVFIAPALLLAVLPAAAGPFLPTSILNWFVDLAQGASVGFVTPIVWLVALAALGAIAARRMGQLEL